MIHDARLVFMMLSVHGVLVRRLLGIVQLNEGSDIIRLPLQEPLLEVLGINDVFKLPLHLLLP